MLNPVCKFADGVSFCASQLANVSVLVLTVAMVYEVFARYVFDAPTVWSFDIAYMSNGALFMLGVAWVLKIGRASCRERVCQYVLISVLAVSLKQKDKTLVRTNSTQR